ncbi:MAG: aquaporin [Gemmatimonadales bacterium]|nr:aquaporin [Gemmatimonadales bacterium]
MHSLFRRSLAEGLGTFGLVFFGAGAVATQSMPNGASGVLGVALAHGLVLGVLVTGLMGISGGHLNPAVTLGLVAVRRTEVRAGAAYIAAQLLGAVLAALLLQAIYPIAMIRGMSLGAPAIANSIQFHQAILIEAVMAFLLVSAVFGTCINPAAPRIGGFGIGLALTVDILVGGPLTGAAVNPARAFGPALVSGQWVAHAVYWVGPILGGVVAALLWEHVLLRDVKQ